MNFVNRLEIGWPLRFTKRTGLFMSSWKKMSLLLSDYAERNGLETFYAEVWDSNGVHTTWFYDSTGLYVLERREYVSCFMKTPSGPYTSFGGFGFGGKRETGA